MPGPVSRRLILRWFALALLASFPAGLLALTSPEEFLGHRVGADRKLARYDKVMEYFRLLDSQSGKVLCQTVGASTLGQPILLAVVSSEKNLAALERWRGLVRSLADPRTLDRGQAQDLAASGKVFLLFLCNQHSTEIASSNTVMDLAFDLASGNDPLLERALDDVFVMIVPSANPDGQIMVVDYYDKYLGTPYEGGTMPWLYHHYAGHDNNRDWFMLNLAETDALVDVLYGNWHPQVMVDVHQMGLNGVRMFVPPFCDPPNPNNHPLVWNQIELLGSYMKYRLQEADKKGVINNAYYSGWYQGSVRPNATQHNITALLTESAGVNIATPVYVDPAELTGTSKGLVEYGRQMNFTDPWPGGWWRLRDIVDYQLVMMKSMVDACSKNRREFLLNFYRMAAEAVAAPESGPPYAYLVPPDQHDPGSTARMLKIFERTRCEMHRAEEQFEADGQRYPAGTVVLKLGQPYGKFIKDLLEVKPYPDLRLYPGGPPQSPYDVAAWTVSLLMGVEVKEIASPFQARLRLLDRAPLPPAGPPKGRALLDCRDVNAFRAVNRLLAQGARVYRYSQPVTAAGAIWPAGAFLVEAGQALASAVADSCRVAFADVQSAPGGLRVALAPGKIGLYRGWLPSTDEGWTRLILDRFDFPYQRLTNERVKQGGLLKDFNVIILPDMGRDAIIKGAHPKAASASLRNMPPEYQGGIGEDGVEALESFVRRGGVLVALREACRLPLESFQLPVKAALQNVPASQLYCPGSVVALEVDNSQPVGYGMPEQAAGFFADGLFLETSVPASVDTDRRVVARYGRDKVLLSGWFIGEKLVRGTPAVVDVTLGQGHVVLCGLGVQNRAQTYGTFKLLFNAVFCGYK